VYIHWCQEEKSELVSKFIWRLDSHSWFLCSLNTFPHCGLLFWYQCFRRIHCLYLQWGKYITNEKFKHINCNTPIKFQEIHKLLTSVCNKGELSQRWKESIYLFLFTNLDHLCGLVVRVLGYRSGGLGSIPGTTRKKKNVVGLERGALSLMSTNWGATW
jgi:hypothetical protein